MEELLELYKCVPFMYFALYLICYLHVTFWSCFPFQDGGFHKHGWTLDDHDALVGSTAYYMSFRCVSMFLQRDTWSDNLVHPRMGTNTGVNNPISLFGMMDGTTPCNFKCVSRALHEFPIEQFRFLNHLDSILHELKDKRRQQSVHN